MRPLDLLRHIYRAQTNGAAAIFARLFRAKCRQHFLTGAFLEYMCLSHDDVDVVAGHTVVPDSANFCATVWSGPILLCALGTRRSAFLENRECIALARTAAALRSL